MYTLRKDDRSPYHHTAWELPDGSQKTVSTKMSDKLAANVVAGQAVMFSLKHFGKEVPKIEVHEAAKILAKTINVDCHQPHYIDVYLPELAERVSLSEASKSIKLLVANRVSRFVHIKYPGQKRDIWDFSRGDGGMFLSWAKKTYSLSDMSLRTYGQSLHVMLEVAWKQDYAVPENVMDWVKLPKRPKTSPRRGFTPNELRTLYWGADEEWRGMIVIGASLGMRIGDVSVMIHRDVDLEHREVLIQSDKAGEFERKPIPPQYFSHFERMCAGKALNDPLFPRAYKWWMDYKGSVRVSMEFRRLLECLGLRKRGKVRGQARYGVDKHLPLTFHCLRHNFVTMIQMLGASQAIAGALAGHRSTAVVGVYTHIPMEALRAAVQPLPDLFNALPEQGEAV